MNVLLAKRLKVIRTTSPRTWLRFILLHLVITVTIVFAHPGHIIFCLLDAIRTINSIPATTLPLIKFEGGNQLLDLYNFDWISNVPFEFEPLIPFMEFHGSYGWSVKRSTFIILIRFCIYLLRLSYHFAPNERFQCGDFVIALNVAWCFCL